MTSDDLFQIIGNNKKVMIFFCNHQRSKFYQKITGYLSKTSDDSIYITCDNGDYCIIPSKINIKKAYFDIQENIDVLTIVEDKDR